MDGRDEMTMRETRAAYFRENGFGDDGGYGDRWVHLSLGPIPFPFPNTPMRVRAVRYHDLHHVLTGYRTDLRGEFEISAWEIAAGCRGFVAAWQLNLSGIAAGLVICPRRILRAFARGRRSESLYGRPLEDLLDMPVHEVRRMARVPSGPVEPTRTDGAWLGLAAVAGVAVGLATLSLGLVTLPVAYAAFAREWYRERRLQRA